MKYLLFSFLAIGLFLTSACDNDQNEGSGNVITDDRTTSTFSAIEVDDAFEVTIRQGADHQVLISSDDNIISRINTSTTNGVLTVTLSNGSYRNTTLRVEVTAPQLDRIELGDAIRGELIDFVSANDLIISINDATKLDMSGFAPKLELNVNDASQVNGFNFTTSTCNTSVRDASKVELTVTDRLEGSLRDASTFRFRGSPEQAVEVSDGSSVIDAN
jgi:hypothetical protein